MPVVIGGGGRKVGKGEGESERVGCSWVAPRRDKSVKTWTVVKFNWPPRRGNFDDLTIPRQVLHLARLDFSI